MLLLAFLVLSLTGCGTGEAQLEATLENELTTVVGPAEKYDVDVSGLYPVVTGFSVAGGSAERVTAVGRKVRPEGTPVLERLEIEVTDIHYDAQSEQVTSLADAVMEVRVNEPAATEYLEAMDELEGVSLELVPPNRISITTRLSSGDLKLPAPVKVEGRFRAEGARLLLDIQEVSGAGVLLGGLLTDLLSSAVNPVIDLSQAPYGVRFEQPRVESESLVVSARGSL